MTKQTFHPPIHLSVLITDAEQMRAVYSVLGNPGLVDAVLLASETSRQRNVSIPTPVSDEHKHEPAADEPAGDIVPTGEPQEEAETDAAGVPFDPERHTGTKLKSGLWRMKKGFERPEDEAEPETDETPSPSPTPSPASPTADGATEPAGGSPTPAPESAPASPEPSEDDDFAAFREAAEETPSAAPSAREWSDADLSALLNQAAMKLGGPEPIKPVIADFMPEGSVVHSRHIPAERREEFAQKIEEMAEFEFAG